MPSIRLAEIRALAKMIQAHNISLTPEHCYQAAETFLRYCDEKGRPDDEGPRNLRGKCDQCPEIKIDEDCTIENCPKEESKA